MRYYYSLMKLVSFFCLIFSCALFTGCRSASDDGDSVYLFSYFVDEADGLHLAWSDDGLKWNPIAGGKSLLKPELGEDKLMRDPSICQGPDGVFHMVWTTSWHDRIIGHAASSDLIHWSEQQVIPVMMHEPQAKNCWAPEVFYDDSTGLFYIFWATTIPGRHSAVAESEAEKGLNHRIYYTSTKDFKEFAPTEIMFNPDFSVIDAAIARNPSDGELLMFFKNENPNPPQKNIRLVRSRSMTDLFPTDEVSEPIHGDFWAEGPSPLFVGKDSLIVYYDRFADGSYAASLSLDGGNTWKDIPDEELSFPEGIRHGTAFKVRREVLEGLLARFSGNPICPQGVYIADPSARVMPDGNMYIYGSLDTATAQYCSARYHVLSTSDALSWTLRENAFEWNETLYAPDAVYRDGKYLLYFDVPNGNEYVAESSSPYGPFEDAVKIEGPSQIDPCVFVDDDGTPYYFWGQYSAKGAKMTPDFKALDWNSCKEGIVDEEHHHFHEGSFVFKRGEHYYYTFADIGRNGRPTCIGYAMSDTPFGPYEYKGVIIDNAGCDPAVWNNHGSVVCFNGQWYVLYHRATHASVTMRKACIEPITFNPDGTIDEVEMTSQGAGPALDAYTPIPAARVCWRSGNCRIRMTEGGSGREELGCMLESDSAVWKYVDFGNGADSAEMYVRSDSPAGLSIHIDTPDSEPAGIFDVPSAEGWQMVKIPVKNIQGIHALWIKCDDGSDGLSSEGLSLDFIRFL